jgi:hypothetical protein
MIPNFGRSGGARSCSDLAPAIRARRVWLACLACVPALVLSACGGGSGGHARPAARVAPTAAKAATPPGGVVVRVGDMGIGRALYEHWMRIGAATVNPPVPGRPAPGPLVYEPPAFAACIAQSRVAGGGAHATTAQLRSSCRQVYAGIQARVLNFLITGYWVRGEAAAEGISVSPAEVRQRFEQERRANYPTADSFRRFQETSRQTPADLMFAVVTQLLSTRMLERYERAHGRSPSASSGVEELNRRIRSGWTKMTDCLPGYVVRDCSKYRQR